MVTDVTPAIGTGKRSRHVRIDPVRSGVRRLLLLAIAGLLAGTAFGFWQGRQNNGETSTGISPVLFDAVVPGLCTMKAQLRDNERSVAYNTFWDSVHQPSHALAAELTARDRVAAAAFQRAKLAVETDLSTLAPTLGTSVDAFEKASRKAVVLVGRTAPKLCP
jgi:hypothetical protein